MIELTPRLSALLSTILPKASFEKLPQALAAFNAQEDDGGSVGVWVKPNGISCRVSIFGEPTFPLTVVELPEICPVLSALSWYNMVQAGAMGGREALRKWNERKIPVPGSPEAQASVGRPAHPSPSVDDLFSLLGGKS